MPRQLVKANYVRYAYFKIPKGLNLEDTTIVKQWWIRYNSLFIEYTDPNKCIEEIDGVYEESDFKFPDGDPEILDADEGYEFLFDEDELKSDEDNK
jgi:hypothetical protein